MRSRLGAAPQRRHGEDRAGRIQAITTTRPAGQFQLSKSWRQETIMVRSFVGAVAGAARQTCGRSAGQRGAMPRTSSSSSAPACRKSVALSASDVPLKSWRLPFVEGRRSCG
jgi:hypothetical protein